MNSLRALLGLSLVCCALGSQPAYAADVAKIRAGAQRAMAATGIVLGKSGPLVVAFEDPNCSFCDHLSQEAEPLIAAGKLRMRIVPVAFLKPDSEARAAGILQSGDPAAAWTRNMAGFDHRKEEGAYPGAQPSFSTDRALRANLALLQDLGNIATPTLLVCPKGAAEPTLMQGIAKGRLATLVEGAGSVASSGGCQR